MKPYFILYGLIVIALLAGIWHNFSSAPLLLAEPQSPIVVELFTSKNCPSCPAADQILADLSENPNVMTISCHVAYWDSVKIKDPLARDFCEVRQHGYASLDTKSRMIYTPQMNVNGGARFVGYKKDQVRSALRDGITTGTLPIEVKENMGRLVSISLPATNTSSFRIWAFGYGHKNENSKTSRITNPALSMDNLGSWDGSAKSLQMEVMNEKVGGLLVVAQENGYGRIVAAGKVDLR